MARDLSLALRKAILAALEDAPAVTAIVPPERLHGVEPPATPAWPYVRYGFAAPAPLRASGSDGVRIVGALEAYARGPGEDAAAALGAAIAAVLDGDDGRGRLLRLDGGEAAHLAWTGSRLRRDGLEGGAYRLTIGFEAVIA
jgi:hypothetical protein